MSDEFDVVIAGAGPVGLMLATELRLAGVRVLVAERLTEIDPTVKAGAINIPTAQAFYRRGLLPELAAHQSETLARMLIPVGAEGDERPRFAGHFAGLMLDATRVDFDDPVFADIGPAADFWFVPQQSIERILGEYARRLGVVVRRGVAVTDFTDDGAGVTIRLGGNTVRAGWLVGCDGGRSTVRKLGGFDFPGVDPEITAYQAVVEMADAEGLRHGWNFSADGVYVYGPWPGRILIVDLSGPPADRNAPVTAADLQAALRTVSGVPVRITAVHSATRFTDNTRQVTEYRRGRVLLAGDAAHVHSPFGGQGLNLGIGDAVNLGWKLASVIKGTVPETLLDTYTAERHPIGAWVLEWTRAQIAVMRPDPRSQAMRAVTAELLDTTDGATLVFKKISGVLHRYDLGVDHPLAGAATPDIELSDGTRLGDHFHSGTAVLLDAADSPDLRDLAAAWSDRLVVVTAKPAVPRPCTALLVRPDGHVAWAAGTGTCDGLREALTRWLGSPA